MIIKPEILIIEDEDDIRELLMGVLSDEGYSTRSASSSIEGIKLFSERKPSLIILDVWLGYNERDGLDLLQYMKKEYPFLPIIMISGHATIEKAVFSLKQGAYDFLEKPFQMDKLLRIVERALESTKMRQELNSIESEDLGEVVFSGTSETAVNIRRKITKYACINEPIFITGPFGSGHSEIAKNIHKQSLRRVNNFKSVIVSTIDSMHLDHYLFGFEVKDRPNMKKSGLFEEAHLGTIFIDEISLIPNKLQNSLYHYLNTGRFKRIGGDKELEVDVEIILGTYDFIKNNEKIYPKLLNLVKNNIIELEPLANRTQDIEVMSKILIEQYCRSINVVGKKIDQEVIKVFEKFNWPGNVLQLRMLCQWMVIKGLSDPVLSIKHLPDEFLSSTKKQVDNLFNMPIKKAKETFEKEFLEHYLEKYKNNIALISEKIGMDRTALHRKIKSLNIS